MHFFHENFFHVEYGTQNTISTFWEGEHTLRKSMTYQISLEFLEKAISGLLWLIKKTYNLDF